MSHLALVTLNNATARLADTTVFSHITLAVNPHEHLAIIGKNGCGKSTLLRLMQSDLRLPQEQDGTIYWGFTGEYDTSPLVAKEHIRLVSPAIQSTYVQRRWNITGLEVVLSGLVNQYLFYDEPTEKEVELATHLAMLLDKEWLLHKQVTAMSQGELRLMVLLRGVIASPALLLLDEPFEGISQALRPAIMALLEDCASKGTTLVITAHRPEDIPACITHTFTMPQGEKQPYNQAQCFAHTSALATPHTLFPSAAQAPLAEETCKICHAFALAQELPLAKGLIPVQADSQELFSMKKVDVYLDRKQVLFGVNWNVNHGEHWVVTGDNGAGKSSLIRLLYGEEFAAVGGEITWCKGSRPPMPTLHQHVGYVSDKLQDEYTYSVTALESVITGINGSVGLYHIPTQEEKNIAFSWLEFFNLEHTAHSPIETLSTGTLRRVLLARAMACSPSLLLLDEPCSGLDHASRQVFHNCLASLAEQGVQLIYVSHHAKDIPLFFTHELALRKGHTTYIGPRRP